MANGKLTKCASDESWGDWTTAQEVLVLQQQPAAIHSL